MLDKAANAIVQLTIVALLLAVLLGGYNAIARYFDKYFGFGISSNAFLELQWQLFSFVFLAGFVLVSKWHSHIKVDVFTDRLTTKKVEKLSNIGDLVLFLPFTGIVAYTSWTYFFRSIEVLEKSPQPQGLPLYYVKGLLPLFFSILFVQKLFHISRRVKK